jgi:protein dithiol:quinone oxidoreductase
MKINIQKIMFSRWIFFYEFALVAGLLLFGFYLEKFHGVIPCPLCTLQRICFGLMEILIVANLIFYPKRVFRLVTNLLITIVALLGIVLAGRQIWLQHFPNVNGDECSVSIHYMLQILPWQEVLNKVFKGSAECSQQGWTLLSFNIAEWSLLWFCLFFVLNSYLILQEFSRRKNHQYN